MKNRVILIKYLAKKTTIFCLLMVMNHITIMGQDYQGGETSPTYPGGIKALKEFIDQNVIFPDSIKKEGISGIVTVSFRIEKDGKVDKVKLVRGIHPVCDSEAIRVARLLAYWQPGTSFGKPISCNVLVPIEFRSEKIYCNTKPVVVNGTVTEKTTEKPVESALLVVKGTNIGTLTDINGNYSFEIPAEYLDLEISSLGYTKKTITIGRNRTINIELDKEYLIVNL